MTLYAFDWNFKCSTKTRDLKFYLKKQLSENLKFPRTWCIVWLGMLVSTICYGQRCQREIRGSHRRVFLLPANAMPCSWVGQGGGSSAKAKECNEFIPESVRHKKSRDRPRHAWEWIFVCLFVFIWWKEFQLQFLKAPLIDPFRI